MKKTVIKYTSLILVILCIGCNPKYMEDPKSYIAFLNDPKNGLVKEKTIAGIKFKLRYIPTGLTAYNQLKNLQASEMIKDSIKKSYDNSLTFILNIGPADDEKFDITRVDISNYRQFADRIEQLSFQTQEYISLSCGDSLYKPSITKIENINAPENGRNFIVVFDSEKNTAKDLRKHDLCFIYKDEMFSTGVNKFMFTASDINAVPELKF